MKVNAYVGNKNRFDYHHIIESAIKNGFMTYDLMNTSEEHITQDLLEANKLVIIGDWWELPKDARDIMALAQIIGKPVKCLNDVPVSIEKNCVVDFCTSIVEGIAFSEFGNTTKL